ncbi:MAG: malate dehydrogenase [Candidatus Omnitrophota bacterium]|nr:malate dehydrogenase [Candidatus Omnitrophota bacterium]
MSKIAVIGAGNVGSLVAMRIAEANLADLVLLDVISGIAIGKALDMEDASVIMGHNRTIKGTADFSLLEGCDIVVITAGFSRNPGMSRVDLLNKNAQVIRGISRNLKELKKEPIVIVVTNPVDILTYLVLKITGFDKRRVMGLGGSLDTARFINLIRQELKVSYEDVKTFVIGAHSENMIPLVSKTQVKNRPLTEILSEDKIKLLVDATQKRGATIVSNLGSGSAYFAPSAAILEMVKAIILDEKKEIIASSFLDGEYDLKDICFGVPVIIGKNGIEKIVKLELAQEEHSGLINTAKGIKQCLICA